MIHWPSGIAAGGMTHMTLMIPPAPPNKRLGITKLTALDGYKIDEDKTTLTDLRFGHNMIIYLVIRMRGDCG